MKNLFSDIKLGFKSYYDAILFIKAYKLWWYFLFPILIFMGIYYLGFLFQTWKTEVIIPEDSNVVMQSLYMLKRMFFALLAVIMLSFMRYVIIIILSPVLSVVSERVERILTGNKYKFNLKQLIKDVKRTTNLAIRNIIWELGIIYTLMALIYFIFWMIGMSESVLRTILVEAVAITVAFYYYGFGFIDYMNERRRLSIPESVEFVRKKKGFALALGSVFTLIFVYSNDYLNHIREDVNDNLIFALIMVASIILAMIPIITMVAATLGVHSIVDLRKNPFALRDEEKIPNTMEKKEKLE